jgi:hypothetical protein
VDDDRIRQLTAEVMSHLQTPDAPRVSADLERRVAALESVVARLQRQDPAPASAERAPATHPSLRVLPATGPASQGCVMEPDKPCVQSHACRTFGH